MKYKVKKWKTGYGIFRGFWFIKIRVKNVGPFGLDYPWIVESNAKHKADELNNN